MRGWKQTVHENGNEKKIEVEILISDTTDFKIKNIRDKEGHFIMIKISIQEDVTSANIYAPNTGAYTHQHIRKTLIDIKGEMHSNTIIVRRL